MIFIVQGKVGEGKSYHLVKLAASHLCTGGIVATNMIIHLDEISRSFHRRLSSRQLIKISAADSPFIIPRGDFRGRGRRKVLVILDEALNWFSSSPGAKDDRKATWGEWLRQSDKLGQDVYFVAQCFDRAAKWIRELSQVVISITNLKNVSLLRLPFGKWFHLDKIYVAASYDVRAATLVRWSINVIEPRIWKCYETSELFGFPASGNAYDGFVLPRAFRLPFWPFLVFLLSFFLSWWLA